MAKKNRLENPNYRQVDRLVIIAKCLEDYVNRTDRLTRDMLLLRLKNHDIVVDAKTVGRDIKKLINDYEAPVTHSAQRGFYLTDPSWSLDWDLDVVSADDVYAMSLATALTAQFTGTPLHDELQQLTKAIKARYKGGISLPDVGAKVKFFAPPAAPINPVIWQAMMIGLLEKRWMKLQYQPYEQNQTELIIAPCRLVSLENEWYLFSRKRGDLIIRQLAVRNIFQAEVLRDCFTDDSSAAVQKAIDHRFGWFACDRDIETITVVFDKAMNYLLDTRTWHNKQTKRILENGDLEISFPTSSAGDERFRFFEVRKWILSYGRYVKSISPAKLKKYVLEDLKAALSNLEI